MSYNRWFCTVLLGVRFMTQHFGPLVSLVHLDWVRLLHWAKSADGDIVCGMQKTTDARTPKRLRHKEILFMSKHSSIRTQLSAT